MSKRIYLTKKRLGALDLALNLDDILHEKFRRLNEQLHKDVERQYSNRLKVFRVIKRGKDYDEALCIIDVQMTGDGSTIFVK